MEAEKTRSYQSAEKSVKTGSGFLPADPKKKKKKRRRIEGPARAQDRKEGKEEGGEKPTFRDGGMLKILVEFCVNVR